MNKTILFLAFGLLTTSSLHAQTTIWIETFEDLSTGTQTDNGVTSWSVSNATISTDATNFDVANVNSRVAGGDDNWFHVENTNLSSSSNVSVWQSEAIDISAYNTNGTGSGVDITIDLYESGNWEGDDDVCIYYQLGATGSCGSTSLTDGDFADDNGFTATNNFEYRLAYATAVGASSTETTLTIFIEVNMDDNGDHFYFDNVRVSSSGLGFTERATAASLTVSTATKEGGHAWGDFNNDGCLDILVNQGTSNGSGNNADLYQQDKSGDVCQGTFTDVTATLVDGMNTRERSVVWADFNNDGYLDFAHNTNNDLDIYFNWGPDGSNQRTVLGIPNTEPDYGFGTYVNATNNQDPSINVDNAVVTGNNGVFNTEGMGWADFNKDGWLDLVIDNHNDGTIVLQKIASTDGTGCATDGFNAVDQDDSGLTRLLNSSDGDFLAIGDYDDDGDPDLFIRKDDVSSGQNDIFENIYVDDATTPYYQVNTGFGGTNTSADNSDKGAAVFCDLDNDGDLDAIWTSQDENQVFEQTSTGVFTVRGIPEYLLDEEDIDGCACGDVDNDGDNDLFLTDNSGKSYLLINNYDATISDQNFTFSRFLTNTGVSGIDVNANGESTTFADYDNDGDLDIYIQVNSGSNQLWRNDMLDGTEADADKTYLKVRVVIQDPVSNANQTFERNIIGAHVTLLDNSNNIVGGIREISGGKGHGSQDPAVVHFGISDPTTLYKLVIRTTEMNSVRVTDTVTVTPNSVSSADRNDQTYTQMYPANWFGLDICNTALPITLTYFKAKYDNGRVRLNWETLSQINNDYFTIERSSNGQNFEAILRIEGAGTNYEQLEYEIFDEKPLSGIGYYRLKQTDFDGTTTYSKVQFVNINSSQLYTFDLYPNPSPKGQPIYLRSYLHQALNLIIQVHDISGKLVLKQNLYGNSGSNEWPIPLPQHLTQGIYIVKVSDASGLAIDQLKISIK